jgi:hypothetical protein
LGGTKPPFSFATLAPLETLFLTGFAVLVGVFLQHDEYMRCLGIDGGAKQMKFFCITKIAAYEQRQ